MSAQTQVAILAGGPSQEREISLQSAAQIAQWLESTRHRGFVVDVYDWTHTAADGRVLAFDLGDFTLGLGARRQGFDAALIATHGAPGENGILQGYLDTLGIPYTTGGVLAQALSFDKAECKRRLEGLVPMARSITLNTMRGTDPEAIISELGLPLFVKPSDNGSSVGVTPVKQAEELIPALEEAFRYGHHTMVEAAIQGTEVSAGIVVVGGREHLLPITELRSPAAFFDFQTKYDGTTQEITPAPLPDGITHAVQAYTSTVFHALNLRGMARADFIIREGTPYFLEINTVPGMTAQSILPKQVQAYGWSMPELLGALLDETIARGNGRRIRPWQGR